MSTRTSRQPAAIRQTRPRRQRIVVGVDGSACSRAALSWAAREAAMRGAELHIIHVWQDPIVIGATGFPAVPDDPANARAAARDLLERATIDGLADATPLPTKVAKFLMEGTPAAALLEAAKDADLLVVGRRGHSGISRLLMGSVSMQCLHHARMPLAIVPEPPAPGGSTEEPGHGR